MRTTHTYAIVEIGAAAYAEIRAKLVEANYDHLISSDGTSEVIDMNGLAVAGKVAATEISEHEMMRGLATQNPPEAPPWIEQPLGAVLNCARSIREVASHPMGAGFTPSHVVNNAVHIIAAVNRALYQVRAHFATGCLGAKCPACSHEAAAPQDAGKPLPFIRVESTNVWAYAYTPDNQTLHVQFKSGGSYQYSPATAEDLRQFVETPSKGGFIAQLKNRPGVTVVFVENWKAVLGLAARS